MTGARSATLGLLAVALIGFWQATRLESWSFDGPGAGFFPQLVAGLCIALALVVLVAPGRPGATEAGDTDAESTGAEDTGQAGAPVAGQRDQVGVMFVCHSHDCRDDGAIVHFCLHRDIFFAEHVLHLSKVGVGLLRPAVNLFGKVNRSRIIG